MKTRLLLLYGVALAALLFAGCTQWPWQTDGGGGNTTQNVNVTIPGGPSGVPASPPVGNCAPVATVTVSAHLGGTGGAAVTSFSAKETVTLDATPKDGLGQKLDPACHGASVAWATSRTDCSITGATTGFNPDMSCGSEGPVTVTAVVAQPGGIGTAAFTVLP
jgi:hypothetical protein